MSWRDYYRLIEEYGSVAQAPLEERLRAARANPNNPADACKLAEYKWATRKEQKHGH